MVAGSSWGHDIITIDLSSKLAYSFFDPNPVFSSTLSHPPGLIFEMEINAIEDGRMFQGSLEQYVKQVR